jgi:hypothetical protein
MLLHYIVDRRDVHDRCKKCFISDSRLDKGIEPVDPHRAGLHFEPGIADHRVEEIFDIELASRICRRHCASGLHGARAGNPRQSINFLMLGEQHPYIEDDPDKHDEDR